MRRAEPLGQSVRVWDALFDALGVLLWKPTEQRPVLALRLWLLAVTVTFGALLIYLVAR